MYAHGTRPAPPAAPDWSTACTAHQVSSRVWSRHLPFATSATIGGARPAEPAIDLLAAQSRCSTDVVEMLVALAKEVSTLS
jgi:hypothetical protein